MKTWLVLIGWLFALIGSLLCPAHAIALATQETDAVNVSVQTIVAQMKQVYSADIIMGTPLEVEGQKLIPLATVGVGYTRHRMTKREQEMQGVGGILIPVGIIVVSGKDVRLVQVSKGFGEQLLSGLAPVLMQLLNRQTETTSESQGDVQKKAPAVTPQKSDIGKKIGSWYIRIAFLSTLIWLILIVIIKALFPQQVFGLVSTLRQSYSRAGFVGLLSFGAVFLLIVVFTISLIGIPLTLVVIVLTKIFTIFGTVGLAFIVGQYMTGLLKKATMSEVLCTLLGGIVIGIVGMIPILGWMVWMLVSLLGFGAAMQMQWERMRVKN